MSLIPSFPTVNYGARPIDFSPMFNTLDQINEQRKQKAQEQRLKKQKIDSFISEYDPTELASDIHRKTAAEKIRIFEEDYAKLMTFEKDKQGKITNIVKRDPKISDVDYSSLTTKAAKLYKEFSKWKSDDEAMSKYTEEFNKNPDKYDMLTYTNALSDYQQTGELSKKVLDVSSANPFIYFASNKEFDTRNEFDKKPTQIMVGDKIKSFVKGMNPQEQDQIYYGEANKNYALQKGLVDSMMGDHRYSTQEKLDYIAGNMAGTQLFVDPKRAALDKNYAWRQEQLIKSTYSKAQEVLTKYQNEREFDPYLIQAAIDYGADELKINRSWAQGSERLEQNKTLYDDTVKRARDKSEDEKENKDLIKTEKRNIVGYDLKKYNDISAAPNTKRDLEGLEPLKGLYYLEKPEKEGDYKVERKNSPKESAKPENFLVEGYDTDEGVIVLTKKTSSQSDEEKGDIERKYFLPIKGNEEILDRLKKNKLFKEENQTGKKTIEWAM